MSNAFSLSSKGSECLIFAPNYLTNCVTYYGAKIIHEDSFEDCKKVLDIVRGHWREEVTKYDLNSQNMHNKVNVIRVSKGLIITLKGAKWE